MYAYISGQLTYKSPTEVYIETHGVGYHLHISLNTFSEIEKLNEVRLFTHFHVKEDGQTLYGFYTEAEKELFQMLISVKGVGPNTARIILSSMKPDDVQKAIFHEDVLTFNRVKGIGPKTAKQIILDLKDKVAKTVDQEAISSRISHNTQREDALKALVALGMPKPAVVKVLDKLLVSGAGNLTVEQIIKEALKLLR